ncbi:MAG: hypothetical protein JXR07_09945 [Reichenbachiella sp.]
MEIVIIWIGISAIIGVIGADKNIGMIPAFLLSIFLTPITGLILTFSSESKESADQEILRIKAELQKAFEKQKQNASSFRKRKRGVSPERALEIFKLVKLERSMAKG